MKKLKDLQRSVRAKDREIRHLNERIQDLLQVTNNTKMGARSKSTSRNAVPKRYANFVEDRHDFAEVDLINDQKRKDIV